MSGPLQLGDQIQVVTVVEPSTETVVEIVQETQVVTTVETETQVVEVLIPGKPGAPGAPGGPGPPGPPGPPGQGVTTQFFALTDVNPVPKTDSWVPSYQQVQDKLQLSDPNVLVTITDGGNF